MLADLTLIYYPVIVCDSYRVVHDWAVVSCMFVNSTNLFVYWATSLQYLHFRALLCVCLLTHSACVAVCTQQRSLHNDYGKRHDATLGLNAGYAGASDPLVPLGQCSAGQRVQDALIGLLSTQTICSLTGCC
jgi:hypothetical protein